MINDKEYLKREYIIQNLKKVSFFSDLNSKELDRIAAISETKRIKKGEIIFNENDTYRGFYCVAEGTVKIFKVNKEGRESIINIAYSHETFAELPLFDNPLEVKSNKAVYPASAMGIGEITKIIFIPAKEFSDLMRDNYLICYGMLSGLSRKIKILQTQVVNVKSLDVTKRLVNYILTEYEAGKSVWSRNTEKEMSETITLNIAKIDLASYLGATLETISRTFKKLQEDKLLRIQGRKITLLNIPALKKML
jgi:CRP/FNR family transcriptional regulator